MFKGSIPALITPFDGGTIDHVAIERLVAWHISEGSHGLVAVGTTGESPTMSHTEHKEVIEAILDSAAKRIPVIAGTGSNYTEEAISLTQFAEKAGADAALIVTPYYNKPTQAGIIAHFTAIHNATNIPIILYNIPGRCGVDIEISTMAKLSRLPRIIGVKDATAKLDRAALQRRHCGPDFLQISGEDPTALAFNALGGKGCISVTANVAPKLCAQMQEASLSGNYSRALELHDLLMPLHEAIFIEPGVSGAKFALSELGICRAETRLPLSPVSENTAIAIRAALREAGLTSGAH